ncbi:MAG: tetraacyldisaccharide 4'-kinase [Desulfobacterales bacterium]|nr:tetraacyldisaccharide 4'-kinase [Desulfobacterales bacterium]
MQADFPEKNSHLYGLLYAASGIYGAGVRLRDAGFRAGMLPVKSLPCRVISIGNITAGGTGKTPMAIYMARQLQQMGYRPAVLSRGYMGGAEKTGAVVSDGHSLSSDSRAAGDEPFLMACRLGGVPVLVGANRYQSGMRAVTEFDPDTIILDDAFQHRQLSRDLDLVLIDAKRGVGRGHLLPCGMLREPVSGLARADAVVLTRSEKEQEVPDIPVFPDTPVFRAGQEPYLVGVYDSTQPPELRVSALEQSTGFECLEGRRMFAFSGIAQNREFRGMLEDRVGALCGFAEFADHYFYTERDLREIADRAQSCGSEYLVTTEKDFMRIAGRMPGTLPLAVVGVEMAFVSHGEEQRFLCFVRRKLAGKVSEA